MYFFNGALILLGVRIALRGCWRMMFFCDASTFRQDWSEDRANPEASLSTQSSATTVCKILLKYLLDVRVK